MTLNTKLRELPLDLQLAIERCYEPNGIVLSTPEKELESSEYSAYSFSLNQLSIRFRIAKTTPKKIGLFVTLWKRIGSGPIMPFDISDPVDFYIVSVRAGENFGQFIFPKDVLCSKGVLSKNGKGGKRAIRVYPPWDKPTSSQAKATQKWQVAYFLDFASGEVAPRAATLLR